MTKHEQRELVAEMPMVRSLWDARCHFCGGPSFPWMTDDATWAQVEPMLGQHQACFECFMLARHMLDIDNSTPMRVGVCRDNESRNPHSKNLRNVGQFQGGQIPDVLEAAALELDRLMDEGDVLRAAMDRYKERMTRLERERDDARQTIQRLNRRAQGAEAAIADLRRCVEAVNNGKPWCGGSLGRAFLAWQVERMSEQNAALVKALDMIANGHITNTNDAAVVIRELRRIAHTALEAVANPPANSAPLRED